MDITLDFEHRQMPHRETGVISNILTNRGYPISEPMAFGIGGRLLFGHLPFIKMNYIAMITYRQLPGKVFKTVGRSLGIRFFVQNFRNKTKAMDVLDDVLDRGIPAAAQYLRFPALIDISYRVTAAGDLWRQFALEGARVVKGRKEATATFDDLAEILMRCADEEKAIFQDLRKTGI